MKRILFIVAILLSYCSWGQMTHTSNGNVDKTAQSVLKQTAKKMNASAVSFTATMTNKDAKKTETSKLSAKVLYSKGRYKVTAENQMFYSDGKSIWHWNKDVNEVTIENLSQSDDLTNPLFILTSYEKNFKAKYIRTESDGTSVIDLTPIKGKSYHKIRLLIDSNNQLRSLEIHNYDGSMGEYKVTNFKSGVSCSDKDFVFDAKANPNVEIIDMR